MRGIADSQDNKTDIKDGTCWKLHMRNNCILSAAFTNITNIDKEMTCKISRVLQRMRCDVYVCLLFYVFVAVVKLHQSAQAFIGLTFLYSIFCYKNKTSEWCRFCNFIKHVIKMKLLFFVNLLWMWVFCFFGCSMKRGVIYIFFKVAYVSFVIVRPGRCN